MPLYQNSHSKSPSKSRTFCEFHENVKSSMKSLNQNVTSGRSKMLTMGNIIVPVDYF